MRPANLDAFLVAAGGGCRPAGFVLARRRAWPLGFVALLPWLLLLERQPSWAASLRWAWLLSVVFTAAVFPWFGFAIGRYTGWGEAAGLGVLLLLAPLFQPQLIAFVLLRFWLHRRGLAGVAALAWVGVEWLVPKLLGDTLGHGLYPAVWLRQAADLGGAAGLTLLLLWSNEALRVGLQRRADGPRAWGRPLLLTLLPGLLLAGYGALLLSRAAPAPGQSLRIGLVQANIADLEARRRAQGSHAVVREPLDTHFAMSFDAIERQGADAVLWSETVYPTPFGNPRSAAGAELDAEILATVAAAGRPFVFGSYELDSDGKEYNAAVFLDPRQGLLGHYRKTRLFPFTEQVPAGLDGPLIRRWLPWAGNWQAGNGPRLMPLRLKDGSELPVQALICRDDVDPGLAIAAARLGARALLTMSNDAWFSEYPVGAELHQAVAAFRSIETRLPQFRVTTNGYSAVIDATGRVHAGALMNERALVVGSLPVPPPPRTLMVWWGDWVGGAALGLLGLLLAWRAWPRRWLRPPPAPVGLPPRALLLPTWARIAAGLLRGLARAGLLGLGAALLLDENLRGQTLAQLRAFAALVLAPELIALCLLAAYRVRLSLAADQLLLSRGAQQLALPLQALQAVQAWRLPLPLPGATLLLQGGARWRLAGIEPARLAMALAAAGGPAAVTPPYAQARVAGAPGWPSAAWAKFVVLPLLLALPAFQLHQQIAYGAWLGEVYSHGLRAYLLAFAIWWAAWALGVALLAAVLRLVIELGTWASLRWRPAQAAVVRWGLERAALGLLYLGLPVWLAVRGLG